MKRAILSVFVSLVMISFALPTWAFTNVIPNDGRNICAKIQQLTLLGNESRGDRAGGGRKRAFFDEDDYLFYTELGPFVIGFCQLGTHAEIKNLFNDPTVFQKGLEILSYIKLTKKYPQEMRDQAQKILGLMQSYKYDKEIDPCTVNKPLELAPAVENYEIDGRLLCARMRMLANRPLADAEQLKNLKQFNLGHCQSGSQRELQYLFADDVIRNNASKILSAIKSDFKNDAVTIVEAATLYNGIFLNANASPEIKSSM
ncbi:MAG: hypothetical protein WCG27_08275 [Pseudomonadota bacterium]